MFYYIKHQNVFQTKCLKNKFKLFPIFCGEIDIKTTNPQRWAGAEVHTEAVEGAGMKERRG